MTLRWKKVDERAQRSGAQLRQHRTRTASRSLTVPVSNMAIDNAAFDLMAFVQAKFTLALKLYLAKKIYSLADWERQQGSVLWSDKGW